MAKKFIKKKFHIDTLYMRVEFIDGDLYKGLAICFDKDEKKLKTIVTDNWLFFNSCKHLIEDITEAEFQAAYDKMLGMIKDVRIVKI